MRANVNLGDSLTCAETGKPFIAERDGCSFNYATNDSGEVFSDEGVDIREKRELLDRSRPFTAYLSSDGKSLTGWKGNILGRVVSSNRIRLTRLSFTHGKYISAVRIRDVHGALWYGRGSPGICITIRAMKG